MRQRNQAGFGHETKDANWVKPVTNESTVSYKGFDIFLAQDKSNGNWLWAIEGPIGEDSGGEKHSSKGSALSVAKRFVDSYTRDW